MKMLIKRLLLPGYDLEKERAIQEAIVAMRRLDAENKSMQAKIEAMEQQKPVGKFTQHPSNGLWEQDGYGDNPEARPLYALPGAKAQNATSVPSEEDESVRKAWARFSNELHRSPHAPYPGMSEAFEQHFSQSFTDREWRAESATWAAAWKAAKNHGAQAQPAQRMDMQTADQITQAFKSELQALLDKYGAELSARDKWEGYPECGEDVRMQVDVPAIYDADHNCLREHTEIDLGSWVPSTQAMPKEAKP